MLQLAAIATPISVANLVAHYMQVVFERRFSQKNIEVKAKTKQNFLFTISQKPMTLSPNFEYFKFLSVKKCYVFEILTHQSKIKFS